MQPDLQKIIARIKQLNAISKSTHSRAEAETTTTIAAKLIAEYQISQAQIDADDPSSDPIDLTTEHIIYEARRIVAWKSRLAMGLAHLNGLFIYNAWVRGEANHRKQTRYRIIGKKSNIEITMFMWDFLTNIINDLATQNIPTYHRGVSSERESYCLGCVDGFLKKMQNEREETLKASNNTTAMVLVRNQVKEAKEAFLSKTGIKLSSHSTKSAVSKDGNYASGYVRGGTINVSRPLKE